MIKIVAVGRIKEQYLTDGINEYLKRMQAFDKVSILEVKEVNIKKPAENIQKEGQNILEQISDKDYVITLEIGGVELDSPALANKITDLYNHGASNITFVIGGSNGLSSDVIKRSNYHLSFSHFTFPHQLMRLILCEQLYRALTIINHQEYHK